MIVERFKNCAQLEKDNSANDEFNRKLAIRNATKVTDISLDNNRNEKDYWKIGIQYNNLPYHATIIGNKPTEREVINHFVKFKDHNCIWIKDFITSV